MKEKFSNFSAQQEKSARTVSISSGKGGVGKTSLSINIADHLARLGRKVLICDADLGLANVDIMLDLKPRLKLEDIIKDNKTAEEIVWKDTNIQGVHLLPGASGVQELADLSPKEQEIIMRELSGLCKHYDYLIIDSGAGIAMNTLRFNAFADELCFVVTPEITSLNDCYATMKAIGAKFNRKDFKIIANQATPEESIRIHKALVNISDKNKKLWNIKFLGNVPFNQKFVRSALVKRHTFSQHLRSVPFSSGQNVVDGIQAIAERIDQRKVVTSDTKKNFWEKWLSHSLKDKSE